MPFQKYREFQFGVINAIPKSDMPVEGIWQGQNMFFKENRWRKIPGLTEIHSTQIEENPVWGIFRFHKVVPKQSFLLVSAGANIYKFTPGSNTWTNIRGAMVPNQQVEFLEFQGNCYQGSKKDLWRRYDGGAKTYKVGGEFPPKKFSKIVFNPYAGRFFGIGEEENPDLLNWSAHIDNEGMEKWDPANVQIIESVLGDSPKAIDIFEGKINIFSEHSINSGTVIGVPENWTFQREKSQAGTIAGRTVKRHGNGFLMFTPEYELYQWPQNKFVSKGRVKFNVDGAFAHLACAEIVDDRYYYLCFKSGEAVSTNKYHLWIYDILGDRFYGPHIQYNVVSMFHDHENRVLICGGADDLKGFVLEHRGRNIKNTAMKCHLIGSNSDYGFPRAEKRYVRGWIKTQQEGSLPESAGQLELIVNVDNRYNNPQSQRIVLQDPENQNLAGTGQVKEAVTKRFFIHDAFGKGNAFNYELKHEVLNGDFQFSELEIEYILRAYKKEDRAA